MTHFSFSISFQEGFVHKLWIQSAIDLIEEPKGDSGLISRENNTMFSFVPNVLEVDGPNFIFHFTGLDENQIHTFKVCQKIFLYCF